MKIGITERGDAALDLKWINKKIPKILITKNISLLLNRVDFNVFKDCIFHCTITGLGGTIFESNVPDPFKMLDSYRWLVNKIGIEKVVLRVDPIIPDEEYFEKYHFPIIKECVSRLRISFLDLYPSVREVLLKNNIELKHYRSSIHADLEIRRKLLNRIKEIKEDVEICAEPDLDCTGCISKRDLDALNLKINLADKLFSQRPDCKCLAEKTELLDKKEKCIHNCIYCYWQ